MTCKWCGVDIHDRRIKVCPCCDRNLKTGEHVVYQGEDTHEDPYKGIYRTTAEANKDAYIGERNEAKKEDDLPQGYVTLSYLLMLVFILYGLRQLLFFINFGWNAAAYKGFIKCVASLVFLPKIKVGAESPYIGLVIKVFVYIILVAIL